MNPAAAAALTTIAGAVLALWFFLAAVGGFDSEEDMATVSDRPATSGVERMARAIARAEGFGVAGAVPTLAHNPGDLKIPGWQGEKLGEGISVFDSDAEGWARLYRQLNLIVTGRSKVYSLSMTIEAMGNKWASGAPEWAVNVANALGTETDAPLSEVLA